MSLRSLFKKAGMTLGSLLLACNIGCKSLTYSPSAVDVKHTNLEDEVDSKRPTRLKMWQYPINIVGGFATHILAHEGAHAVTALAQGGRVEEFHPYPGFLYGEFFGGWVTYEPGSLEHLSPREHALRNIAGPVADIALAETINCNLRNGRIPKKYQPFWATTSLMARVAPIWIAVGALRNPNAYANDFLNFERNTGVSKETMASVLAAYTLLSSKRIVKELKVALGRDTYPVNTKNSRVDLLPYKGGLMASYTLNF